MPQITTREELKDYCLRKLGYPVIEINVDDDQIEDRVDDALQYYQEFHVDAVRHSYYVHQFTEVNLSNEQISLPEDIISVIRALPLTQSYAASRSFFDVKYQLMLNDMAQMGTYIGDLAYYEQMQQYVSLLDRQLSGQPIVRFRRHMNHLKWHSDMNDQDIAVGDYVVLECYRTIDELQAGVFEYIEIFYNRQRRHSAIGNMSPHQYEQQYKQLNVSTFCG